MKNVKIILTAIFIVIITTFLSSSVYAGTVNSINATENEGKITVSGTVDSSVYAVAVVVYSGSNLEYIETANVKADGTYNKELEKKFDYGTYEVRVADYNGGDYKKVSVEVKKEISNTVSENTTTDNTVSENTTTGNTVSENTSTDNTTAENEVTENNTVDSKEKSNNPTTGDNIAIWITLIVISMLGIVGTLNFVIKNK